MKLNLILFSGLLLSIYYFNQPVAAQKAVKKIKSHVDANGNSTKVTGSPNPDDAEATKSPKSDEKEVTKSPKLDTNSDEGVTTAPDAADKKSSEKSAMKNDTKTRKPDKEADKPISKKKEGEKKIDELQSQQLKVKDAKQSSKITVRHLVGRLVNPSSPLRFPSQSYKQKT